MPYLPKCPCLYICRHGQTEWNLTGQHTSYTDLPLTKIGQKQAKLLGKRLKGKKFVKVFVAPIQRAKDTCKLAGYGKQVEVWEDIAEWNYGKYESRKTVDIQKEVPNWSVFTHGAPGGESPEEITKRIDRVIEKIRGIDGDVAIFSSGHFSRALGARWLGFDVVEGQHFLLSNASLSILSYERDHPAIKLWNDQSHLEKLLKN